MKKLLLAFVVIFLASCSSSKYGNYTQNLPENFNSVFAQNAYTQLSILYPPSTSSFQLSHEFNDEFGINLYEKLKSGGYAIYQPINEKLTSTAEKNEQGITLAYVIDKTEKDMYRVTLFIDGKQLTKCFLIKDGKVASVGFWTKQE
ncbi:MAG: hypothetical protein J6574_01525 [Gilliamella sp.]|nr:hypothetical protein [Gilliamella sp.]